jgi:hypothetical protein
MSGRSRTSVEVPMSDRDQLYPPDQRAWLLAIGRRLRVEYDAVAEPVRLNASPNDQGRRIDGAHATGVENGVIIPPRR